MPEESQRKSAFLHCRCHLS